MKKYLIGAFFLILAECCFAETPAKDFRPAIKVGIVGPITGPLANVGESIMAWEKLANTELAKKKTHYRYEIIVEDDMFSPPQSIMAAKRLVELNKADVVLSFGSPTGVAISTYANSSRTPHLAMAFDPRATVGPFNVSFLTPPSAHTAAFFDFLKKKGYKNIALFGIRNSTWQPVIDELHKQENTGLFKIVYEKIYMPGERDFRLGLQMMPEQQVDAVVLLSFAPEINILGRQYHEQGFKKPIVGFGGSLFLSSQRELFDGDVDVCFSDMTHADEINRNIMGKPLYSVAGPMIYDEIMMLAEIYEEHQGKKLSSAALMNEILQLKEKELILGRLTNHGDRFFYLPINYYKIEKGGFRILKLGEL